MAIYIHAVSPRRRDEDDRARVRQGLRQLLVRLDPLIRASGSFSSSANLRGMLSFLEEADEEFDRLRLVRWARRQVREAVGEAVGRECAAAAGQEVGEQKYCSNAFFCFPWGSPEPQSFGPNFAFFREALAIL